MKNAAYRTKGPVRKRRKIRGLQRRRGGLGGRAASPARPFADLRRVTAREDAQPPAGDIVGAAW